MIPWSQTERRWRDTLLGAMIPGAPERSLPALGDFDTRAFWRQFGRVAPPLVRLGIRVAVWVITLAPLFVIGKLSLFRKLKAPDRERVLRRLGDSRFYLLRQLVLAVKALACFAYFHQAPVRARFAAPPVGAADYTSADQDTPS